jgi:hypothetical protein
MRRTSTWVSRLATLAIAWLCRFLVVSATAHTASTGHLEIRVGNDGLTADILLAIRDLDDLAGLDGDGDGNIVWSELKGREAELTRYVSERVRFTADGQPTRAVATSLLVERRTEGCFAVFRQAIPGIQPRQVGIEYTVFRERDPLHRTLVRFADPGGVRTAVLGVVPVVEFEVGDRDGGPTFLGFLKEGLHHIWTGYDHLAFLLALLLPAVLQRSGNGWVAVEGFRSALVRILGIVTAFTAAHSITLALAALDVLRPPSRWVESAIAASILFAAVGNIRGRTRGEGASATANPSGWARGFWWLSSRPVAVAFLFGLIHGFGFAGVLAEMGLEPGGVLLPLLGFNAGVELGQMACVLVFFPVAFLLRGSTLYRRGLVPGLSIAVGSLACAWLVDRAGGFDRMPF